MRHLEHKRERCEICIVITERGGGGDEECVVFRFGETSAGIGVGGDHGGGVGVALFGGVCVCLGEGESGGGGEKSQETHSLELQHCAMLVWSFV